jgi:glutamate decarboxylase
VWRQREDLSAHVAVSVTYLGGNAESYTLNFSRPASGVYVQYYKFLRYGREGYRRNVARMMALAADIRQHLRDMVDANDTPRFVFLDDGDQGCLPVVTAMLNPATQATYDDIDLQHVLSQYHWYVSGYKMGYLDPLTDVMEPLFVDQSADKTMFRIVVKANLTYAMIHNLVESLEAAFDLLDGVDFSSLHAVDSAALRHPRRRQLSHHC